MKGEEKKGSMKLWRREKGTRNAWNPTQFNKTSIFHHEEKTFGTGVNRPTTKLV